MLTSEKVSNIALQKMSFILAVRQSTHMQLKSLIKNIFQAYYQNEFFFTFQKMV